MTLDNEIRQILESMQNQVNNALDNLALQINAEIEARVRSVNGVKTRLNEYIHDKNWYIQKGTDPKVKPNPDGPGLTLSNLIVVQGAQQDTYNPRDPEDKIIEILQDGGNPFTNMKIQYFLSNIPNQKNVYQYSEIDDDTQVIMIRSQNNNDQGIVFQNTPTNIERLFFVHMAKDSLGTNARQVAFSIGTNNNPNSPMNVGMQQAFICFISGNYCMWQQIGSGGEMN
jgi:hypothetical protein